MPRRPGREESAALGVEARAGHGVDFAPLDRDLEATRAKARAVSDGRASFTKRESDLLLARLLLEQD